MKTRSAGRLGAIGLVVAGAVMLIAATSAQAHEDPPGCFQTGPAIIVSVFRANGTTGVVGSVIACTHAFRRINS